MKPFWGKILYGVLFCVVLPALLVGWAGALETRLPALPPIAGPAMGWALVGLGTALLAAGAWHLWSLGGGLPMSPYPPPRYVGSGIYGWLPHPLYLGFALLMPGVFAIAGTRAGGWIVSPVIWLGTLALVVGHERIDLRRRFGPGLAAPRIASPPDAVDPPRWWHRAAAYGLVLAPWLVAYRALGPWRHNDAGVVTYLPFEHTWTPLAAAGWLGAAAAAWVLLAPLAAPTQAALRRFVRHGWAGGGLLLWCQVVLPLAVAPRSGAGPSLAGWVLEPETGAAPFPSAEVFWVFFAAPLWRGRLPAWAAYVAASGFAAGAVAAGQQSLLAALGGLAVFAFASRLEPGWQRLLQATEQVANSWRDWRLGPVRIINHGAYVGLAAGAGLWLVGTLLGVRFAPAILIVAGCSLLGAGIWAQMLEASSGLSRPFGYYGGIFGGWLGVLAAELWRGEGWMLLAAFALASPLIQAIGRLRCLVQGCCHGRPCAEQAGIRYRQPLSRVCRMTEWQGRPVYPTPLYSILGNVAIFGLLLRLWLGGAESGFVTGAALILTACARFMEEGYRGEPQTRRWAGLAIYQWLAMLFVLLGALAMIVPTPAVPAVAGFSLQPLAYAVPFGFVVWFAMGVDFPESNRRFSRLA